MTSKQISYPDTVEQLDALSRYTPQQGLELRVPKFCPVCWSSALAYREFGSHVGIACKDCLSIWSQNTFEQALYLMLHVPTTIEAAQAVGRAMIKLIVEKDTRPPRKLLKAAQSLIKGVIQ